MPSGKQSKRRRQAAATAPPPHRRQASPRVLIGALAAVVLIAIGIVVGVILLGGSGGSSSSANATTLPSAGDAQQLLAGIPQHGTVLGKPSAPVTMTEWIDLQCPYCQQFETQVLPVLIRKYVRTGKLKVDARKWFLAKLHPEKFGDKVEITSRTEKLSDEQVDAQLLNLLETADHASLLKPPGARKLLAKPRG